MRCARHPKVETAISCGRCGTPICPDCSVAGAVGMLCPACASNRTGHMYQVRPERFALACVLGLMAGTVVGFLLQVLSGSFLFFLLLLGPIIGGAVGEVILRASGRKRGLKIEVVAGASVVLGAGLSLLFSGSWVMLVASPLSLVLYLVAVGLTTAAAVWKIRYL
jgi:hypothetical protein